MEYDNPRHDYKVTGKWELKAEGKKTVKHAYARGGRVNSGKSQKTTTPKTY